MGENKRRDFIKKSILGAAAASVSPLAFSKVDPLSTPPFNLVEVDWSGIRNQFVLTKDRTYMNTASLGPSPKSVIKTMQDWTMKLEEVSETGHSHIKDSRKYIAEKLNVFPEEIAFTRNTTEGVNIIAQGLRLRTGDEVIITNHEHVGGASPWLALAKEKGVKVTVVELNLDGEGNVSKIRNAISDQTKVVFFSHVTCSNGMQLAVREICEVCREKEVLSCVDGAQALGQLNVDIGQLRPDFYVSSGHKWLLGPKGTGILYINKDKLDLIKPTFVGAYTVDNFDLVKKEMTYVDAASREEYGTRDTTKIKGLEEAFKFLDKLSFQKVQARTMQLSDYLYNELGQINGVEMLSPSNKAFRSGIITFKLSNKDYKTVQDELLKTYKFRTRGIYEAGLDGIRVSCGLHVSIGELKSFADAVYNISRS